MNSLAEQLRREIRETGSITFARFMAVALYAPGVGYYEQARGPGRAGDFFTSVSVGPLFGRLLAFQFARWLDRDLPEGQVRIAEAGAHDGRLAADILAWLEACRPDLLERLEYCLLDSSPVRRRWQEETLRHWSRHTAWVEDITVFGPNSFCGLIFANEFLDALPIHRLAWGASARHWLEWRVAVVEEGFAWRLGELSVEAAKGLPKITDELADVLPNGFILEMAPQAAEWWSVAAKALRRGKLFTLDYGAADGWFLPNRAQGTLRAFAHHHVSGDVLANPGGQDLTADVNFTALEEAGLAAGLRTAGRYRQAQFLTRIMAQSQAAPEVFGGWNQKNVRQFQTLTHPEHLGARFQALVQSRS